MGPNLDGVRWNVALPLPLAVLLQPLHRPLCTTATTASHNRSQHLPRKQTLLFTATKFHEEDESHPAAAVCGTLRGTERRSAADLQVRQLGIQLSNVLAAGLRHQLGLLSPLLLHTP